jgi:hypothetical protein
MNCAFTYCQRVLLICGTETKKANHSPGLIPREAIAKPLWRVGGPSVGFPVSTPGVHHIIPNTSSSDYLTGVKKADITALT